MVPIQFLKHEFLKPRRAYVDNNFIYIKKKTNNNNSE